MAYEKNSDGTYSYDEGPANSGVGSKSDNEAGQGAMDPMGFGNKTREGNMNIAAQSRALNREQSVWDQLSALMPQLEGYGSAAYDAAMNPVNDVYGDAMNQVSNYTLPAEAQTAIDNILNSRMAGIKRGGDLAVGNSVAELARKGITSSSTMEGAMGEVGKALQPSIESATSDYWNTMLTEPTKNAKDKYSLASDYGKYSGNAILTKLSTQLDPLLTLYQSANANPFQSNQAAQKTKDSAGAIGGIVKMFA